MSLIEKAVAHLDTLKRAAGEDVDAPGQEEALVETQALVQATLVQDRLQAQSPAQPSAQTQGTRVAQAARRLAPVAGSVREPVRAPGVEIPVSREAKIDIKRLISRGMVTPNLPRSRIAEEYRLIKRPLLKNIAGDVERASLIMVTSAMPGEGKSFTAINLAISMAMELDYRVLLVDADVARPSVLNRLGLPPERGLMDALAGDVDDLSEVMLRTNIDKLTLLPAGMPHARATEMLASDAMVHLITDLVSRYPDRVIVFDSPPLLVTTEARVLATHMGQVVIVVEAGSTTHGTVKQALGTIESCPIRMLVLNKSRENGTGSFYGYKYGYGYGDRSRGQRVGKTSAKSSHEKQ